MLLLQCSDRTDSEPEDEGMTEPEGGSRKGGSRKGGSRKSGRAASGSGAATASTSLRSIREKNRQAQRRFRERQKSSLVALKKQVLTVTQQVSEQAGSACCLLPLILPRFPPQLPPNPASATYPA